MVHNGKKREKAEVSLQWHTKCVKRILQNKRGLRPPLTGLLQSGNTPYLPRYYKEEVEIHGRIRQGSSPTENTAVTSLGQSMPSLVSLPSHRATNRAQSKPGNANQHGVQSSGCKAGLKEALLGEGGVLPQPFPRRRDGRRHWGCPPPAPQAADRIWGRGTYQSSVEIAWPMPR